MSTQDTPSNPAAERDVRDQIVDALRRELMGPWHPEDETDPSEAFPTARYIVGRLAPQDLKIDDVENDALPTGDNDDGETGEASFEPPQVLGFMPSSMGLSFVLNDTCDNVDVHIEWGQYLRAEEPPERPPLREKTTRAKRTQASGTPRSARRSSGAASSARGSSAGWTSPRRGPLPR